MTTHSNIKLTIAFNDPDLDPEELEEQAQRFMAELKQMDEIEVDRVLDPNPPEGGKPIDGFLMGLLTAEVKLANAKSLMGFLGDRLVGKPIELELEANGKKLKVKAHSRKELEAAIKAAQDFVAAQTAQRAETEQEAYQRNLQRYEQEFRSVIEAEYPFSDRARAGLQRLQQVLSLRDEDITALEAPVLTHKQIEYERQQIERQRQETEQLHPKQAKAQAENIRPIVFPQPARSTPQPLQTLRQPEQSPTITRQQFLKWAGFGGGGLAVALLGNQIIQSQKTLENPVPPQLLTSDFETVLVDDKGQIIKRTPVKAELVKEDLGNEVALEMVSIPAGEFLMGDVNDVNTVEKPQHRVQLPAFWMGRFAITQAQWNQVAALPKITLDLKADPSNFEGAKRPVETVSWEEAVEFCDRLSRKTGNLYRLPSEAEWEYACRAGTTTPFYFGATITSDLVNCNGINPYGNAPKGKYRQQTTDVGTFPPNRFGLSDMHGNVWEWCADLWHNNYQDAPTDGSVWTTNGNTERRVVRGGSWRFGPVICRSAYRVDFDSHATHNSIGFRVVCSSPRTLS